MIRKTASTILGPSPRLWLGLVSLLGAALAAGPARSQELDPIELEELVSPIALYPDDILGIILPASTFPLDVVRAARFLDDLELDPSLEPDESWDDSIVALLNYPEVLRLMNDDLDWTWALGEAVLTDQAAVLDAAQAFRSRAFAAGNLRSDDKQIVGNSDGAIEIKPADPEVVYIPVYEPREVVIYNAVPRYRYYPIGYPVYYYPYPFGYSFGIDYFWGVTSYFSIGWHSHYVHLLHHTHRTHPYYLNSYYLYTPYYPRRNVNITVSVNNYTDVWTPSPRRGSRPQTVTVESRTSSVRPRTVTSETQPNVTTTTRTSSLSSSSTARATTGSGRAQSSIQSREADRAARATTGLGDASQRTTTRSVRPQSATRAPQTSSSQSSSQSSTGRVATAPSTTRGSAIGQPTTRPQVSSPAAPRSGASIGRSTTTMQTTQGTSRRASPAPTSRTTTMAPSRTTSAAPRASAPTPRASAPAPRASAPAPRTAPAPSSSSAAIGGSRQAPGSGAAGRTRR
jgi:hypothetical protein